MEITQKMSKLVFAKGDFLRIKLVSLGYTLPKEVASKFEQNKVRICNRKTFSPLQIYRL